MCAYTRLKKDIAANGQLITIKLYNDSIIDGRHREKACLELGVTPKYEEIATEEKPIWTDKELRRYVMAVNCVARQLTVSQRAAIAAKLATAKRGRKNGDSEEITVAEAAEEWGVSEKTVHRAKEIQRMHPSAFEKIYPGYDTLESVRDRLRLSEKGKAQDKQNDKRREREDKKRKEIMAQAKEPVAKPANELPEVPVHALPAGWWTTIKPEDMTDEHSQELNQVIDGEFENFLERFEPHSGYVEQQIKYMVINTELTNLLSEFDSFESEVRFGTKLTQTQVKARLQTMFFALLEGVNQILPEDLHVPLKK